PQAELLLRPLSRCRIVGRPQDYHYPYNARRSSGVAVYPEAEEAMRVGFIGLGNMGEPLAGFVRRAGFSLAVHDLRREVSATLLERGATWGAAPRRGAAQWEAGVVCGQGPAEMGSVGGGAVRPLGSG